jgi:putative transposase
LPERPEVCFVEKVPDRFSTAQIFKLAHKTDREHQLWQEGSHPQMIADEAMMWQKLEYIHNNPVRRGYVDDPIHWRYSSARNYSKLPTLVSVIVDWM